MAALPARTVLARCETIFEARQRIFEAQGIARMLKLHFVDASAQPGVMCCCDAIDYLLQDSLNRLEELE